MPPLRGLLNVNKPVGMTSRRVVDLVQRLARPAKVGHAGTLDPLASGVLVLGVGAGTRLIEYVQQMPKTYEAMFLLGRYSPTEDVEGEVALLDSPPVPSREQIVSAAKALTGKILQRPPDFSALKIEGRRAYDLARRGEAVSLEPRPVVVHAIEVQSYEYPELRLRVECGSGTYVRSLGRDLAAQLGTAAVMAALVRTAIGRFELAEAVDPATLTAENWTKHLLPMTRGVAHLPQIVLDSLGVWRVNLGRPIPRPVPLADSPEYAAVDPSGELLAILTSHSPAMLGPKRVFPSEA